MKRSHLLGLLFVGATLCAVCSTAVAQDAETGDGTEQPEKKEEGPSTLKTLAAFGLTIVGLGITLLPAVQTFSSSYSYAQAKLMLINLLRTNPNQAEQMARQMEGTWCEALANALKVGGSTQSRDLKVIVGATKPTYDGVAKGIVAKWKGSITKAKLGLMAAVGGAGIGIAGGSLPAIPVIIAILAVAAFGRLMWFVYDLEQNIIRARLEVLPEAESAVASGRYIAPPLPG